MQSFYGRLAKALNAIILQLSINFTEKFWRTS